MNDFLGLKAAWLGPPMFDAGPDTRLAQAALLLIVAVLWLVGFLWIRRSIDPGPLARGDAKWRYRDRDRIEDQNHVAASVRLPRRTPGWWATRLEFGVAIASLVAGLAGLIVLARQGPMLGGDPLGAASLLPIAAYAGMWIGLGWMVRIYRAGLSNDAQATWRYRDRQS